MLGFAIASLALLVVGFAIRLRGRWQHPACRSGNARACPETTKEFSAPELLLRAAGTSRIRFRLLWVCFPFAHLVRSNSTSLSSRRQRERLGLDRNEDATERSHRLVEASGLGFLEV